MVFFSGKNAVNFGCKKEFGEVVCEFPKESPG